MKRFGLTFLGVILVASLVKAIDFSSNGCSVVGNANTLIYHAPGGQFYDQMHTKKYEDHRVCFKSESEASVAGYRRSLR